MWIDHFLDDKLADLEYATKAHADSAVEPSQADRLHQLLFAPVDAASLAVFRIAFGLVMVWWCIDDLRLGRVRELFVLPKFHFAYYWFDVVQPWPQAGPYLHYIAMLLLAALIAVGLFYRVCMLLFALCFTIFFLWDRTNYQNHYFLLLLLSWVMVFLPLNRVAAIDALERRSLCAPTVPLWAVWLVRFHIALPYVFGGLAKLNSDWLAGAAMRDFLSLKADMPVVGPWLAAPDAPALFAWGGLLFDLGIVPLLLWKRTRMPAYVAVVIFHVMNHFLFTIHIFPWFMILATTIFYEPDWPRRLLRLPAVTWPSSPTVTWTGRPLRQRAALCLACIYVAFQLLFPLRHHLYGGDIGWHERGHYFAWRMMLRSKQSVVRYYITDPQLGETWHPNLRGVVSLDQLTKFGRDPEMILDLAHYLANEYRRETGREVEVRALVLSCYNGRKPQLLIDPTVDLAKEPRGFYARSWIMPQQEPRPAIGWNRPIAEWEVAVAIPPLPVVTRGPNGERIRRPQAARWGKS